MTDLEKFETLFKEIGIGYGKDDSYGFIIMSISEMNMLQSYGNEVLVKFDDSGKFVEFEGWGE